MVEERSALDWATLGYESLEGALRNLASPDAETRAAAAQQLFEARVHEDPRYLVRSYVVVRYIQLLSHPHSDKYELLANLTQLSRKDDALSEQDNHRIQSLLANNDAAFTPFLNVESLRDYVLEIIGSLHHYADRFVPLLFTSFSHDDPAVVYTLARLINTDVSHIEVYTDFFQANLTSPDSSLRTHAAMALAKLLKEAAPPIEAILLHSRLYTDLHTLADTLSYLGLERATRALLRKLEGETQRDRMFTIVLYLLYWEFEAFPGQPHYGIVPAFFRPKSQTDQSTLVVLGLLARGWLLDKFPWLRKTIFRTANARARYIYFVDNAESEDDVKPPVTPRTTFTPLQTETLGKLLTLPHIWHYETNIFELFGLPNTKRDLSRLFGGQSR